MDSYSITNVKYLDPSELHRWMIEGHTTTLQEPFQVVDVRGSDYMGGHIRDGWHFAYSRLKQDPGYLRELKRDLLQKQQQVAGGRRRRRRAQRGVPLHAVATARAVCSDAAVAVARHGRVAALPAVGAARRLLELASRVR